MNSGPKTVARAAYIHIPFCAHKCDFCDFAAFAGVDHLSDEYCQVVVREINERLSEQEKPAELSSVFYGGGTPGYLAPEQLERIHKALCQRVGLSSQAEVTLETTPGSISRAKCRQWLAMGINRLSIGVESFDDGELQAMGRDHCRKEALARIDLARQSGFENVAIDLMYGLPGQSLESWRQTLSTMLELDLPHVSAYALTFGASSRLFLRYPRQSAVYPGEDACADMYELLLASCQEGGLLQYEISNFSRPGRQSRHNLAYWLNEEYLAFGVSAHRYVSGVRSSNFRSLKRYMRDYLGFETYELIDDATRAKEAIFLGLRLTDGLDLLDFEARYGFDLRDAYASKLAKFSEGGFLLQEGGRLKLSEKGMLVSNLILADFV